MEAPNHAGREGRQNRTETKPTINEQSYIYHSAVHLEQRPAMRKSEAENLVAMGIFLLTLLLILLSPTILGVRALDVTYTSTTTFTTSITHISTREVYETITRTQTSRLYSTITDTITMEGPAPYIQLVSQQWQRPVLVLVLYNGGGPGTVRIGVYEGGTYLGYTEMGAP